MNVKNVFDKIKKPLYTVCIFLLIAYLIMLGLIFMNGMSRRYHFGENEPMRFKVELYLPNGDTEVYRVKGIKITHFGDVISFMNDEGGKISYNGNYKVETEKLPIGEVEDK